MTKDLQMCRQEIFRQAFLGKPHKTTVARYHCNTAKFLGCVDAEIRHRDIESLNVDVDTKCDNEKRQIIFMTNKDICFLNRFAVSWLGCPLRRQWLPAGSHNNPHSPDRYVWRFSWPLHDNKSSEWDNAQNHEHDEDKSLQAFPFLKTNCSKESCPKTPPYGHIPLLRKKQDVTPWGSTGVHFVMHQRHRCGSCLTACESKNPKLQNLKPF